MCATGSPALLVLIPIYNDWDAVHLLLRDLDQVLVAERLEADVLIIDDGSTARAPQWSSGGWHGVNHIDVLALRRNVGHQRALAIALAFVEQHRTPEALIVMDGDGEDAPRDIPRLLECLRHNQDSVVFAERTRRAERWLFRVFYALYRWLHFILTGIPVRVGNFSVIPFGQVRRLVVVPELWNHYAAAVFKAKIPRATVATVRQRRLDGRSRMNFVDLVTHGLSALSVHSELVGVRLLLVTGVLAVVVTLGLVTILAVRLFTSLAIPGWASTVGGLSLVLLFQVLAFAAFFAFLVLHARSQPTFIPLRDYQFFLDDCRTLVARRASPRPPAAQDVPAG